MKMDVKELNKVVLVLEICVCFLLGNVVSPHNYKYVFAVRFGGGCKIWKKINQSVWITYINYHLHVAYVIANLNK